MPDLRFRVLEVTRRSRFSPSLHVDSLGIGTRDPYTSDAHDRVRVRKLAVESLAPLALRAFARLRLTKTPRVEHRRFAPLNDEPRVHPVHAQHRRFTPFAIRRSSQSISVANTVMGDRNGATESRTPSLRFASRRASASLRSADIARFARDATLGVRQRFTPHVRSS